MGAKSGIKWDGISEVQTKETIEIIGAKAQIILRDPKTQQEWIVSSDDYISALVDLGVITSSSGYWDASGDDIFNNNIGNVGVGLNNPFAKLQVQADDDVSTVFVVENVSEDQILVINAAGYSFFKGDVLIGGGTGSYNGNLIIGAGNSTGNIGIHVDNPTEKLEVDGNIKTTGDVIISDKTKSVIIYSPDDTPWRITVANDGTLTAVVVP